MREITFFIDPGLEYQLASVMNALSLDTALKTKILHRDQWLTYDFSRCAVAVTTDSIGPDIARVMKRAKDAGVPSLTIQDGIIEYEHCWKKRLDRFRPLLTDRIAVFGDFTKKILISWGTSEDKIDVTGCPRFDGYTKLDKALPSKPCILLTSANTPFMDDVTKEEFRDSFLMIAKALTSIGIDFFIRLNKEKTVNLFLNEPNVIKRLRQNKHSVADRILKRLNINQRTIAQDIQCVSAVITSVSTIALEAMAFERPVAIFNFSGETTYHKASWEIAGSHQIQKVVQELLSPPPPKILFQHQLFNEYVRDDGQASQRVADIIVSMMSHS